jgi:hypothetical protein
VTPSATRVARNAQNTAAALIAGATIVALLQMASSVPAQDVTEPALKAAFIFNFARFTEWPRDLVPLAEPLAMCVLGDAAVGDALERVAKGRMLAGHRVGVSLLAAAGPPRACQVLYMSGVTASQLTQTVARLRDGPVLTISDVEGFTDIGGIVQFYFEHGQLRFMVHLASAKRARLQISSRLLVLAKIK